MSRSLIVGVLMAPVLVAAPVPKDDTDAGRMQRIYGSVHDPDKGAEFKPSGNSLRIIVPEEQRLLSAWHKVSNAPRVWREDGNSPPRREGIIEKIVFAGALPLLYRRVRSAEPPHVVSHFGRSARCVGEVHGRNLLGRERFAQKRIEHPHAEQDQVVGTGQRGGGHFHRGRPAVSNDVGQCLGKSVIVTDKLIR